MAKKKSDSAAKAALKPAAADGPIWPTGAELREILKGNKKVKSIPSAATLDSILKALKDYHRC